jgi:hypothetical protein
MDRNHVENMKPSISLQKERRSCGGCVTDPHGQKPCGEHETQHQPAKGKKIMWAVLLIHMDRNHVENMKPSISLQKETRSCGL